MTDIATLDHTATPADLPPARGRVWIDEARALMRLAAPLIVTYLVQMAISLTDVLMLGALNKDALAAAGLGLSLYYGAWILGSGPGVAVSSMIAHILGAHPGDRVRVRASVRMALWAVGLLSPGLIVYLHFVTPVLTMIGEPPELAKDGGRFVAILSFGLPFTLAYNVLRGYATALSRPHAALVVAILTVAFNAMADYGLIFGHFGLPALGIIGAGIASASSFVFSFVAMAALVLTRADLGRYRVFRRFTTPSWPALAEVFRLGLPIGVTMIFEVMFFNAGTLIMGRFGASALAAHQIAMTTASFTFMVPYGLASAATVRVGLAAGARDLPRARRAGGVAVSLAAVFMAVCGVTLALFPREIAGLYIAPGDPGNGEVIAYATVFLRIAAAFQLLDAVQVTAALSLRGLKDATMPMWLAGGTYWLIGLPLTFFLAFGTDLGASGVWVAFVVSLAVAAVAMSLRFAQLTGIFARR